MGRGKRRRSLFLPFPSSYHSPRALSFAFIRLLHISHNAPYLSPKILHKHCFQFLLGRLQYPQERKNEDNAICWGGGGRK